MKTQRHKQMRRSAWRWLALLLALALLWGCQSQEPPLSPKAVAFAQVVREAISSFTPTLVAPVSQNDLPAVKPHLEKFYAEEKPEGKLELLRLTILDGVGVVITDYPPNQTIGDDFLQYTAFAQAVQNRRPAQERLYGPDGGELYAIYVPLLDQDRLVGVVRFILEGEKIKKRWGVTTEEILSISFQEKKTKS
jgi:hypothetical protein